MCEFTFFFSSRRRHTSWPRDWSSDVCSSDLQYQPDGDDTNAVNATFYTYLDGHPFWVAGSLGDITPGFDLVTLDMYEYWGGEFFSQPGSYDESDIEEFYAGNMSIEALDCNTLLVGFNFQEGGLGAGEFLAHRLIRVAGYDCSPWEWD